MSGGEHKYKPIVQMGKLETNQESERVQKKEAHGEWKWNNNYFVYISTGEHDMRRTPKIQVGESINNSKT